MRKWFSKVKAHCKNFIYREDGSELMQWAIIIIIVVGLAVVAFGIADMLTGKMDEAADVLDNLDVPDVDDPEAVGP